MRCQESKDKVLAQNWDHLASRGTNSNKLKSTILSVWATKGYSGANISTMHNFWAVKATMSNYKYQIYLDQSPILFC